MSLARSVPVTVDRETFEELLASAEAEQRPLRAGELVEGTVASISGDEVLVDLGGRSAGVMSAREASAEGLPLQPGERVLASVVQPESPDGRVVLSLRRARNRRQWARMSELAKSGELVDAPVVEANRGGLVVDVGLRGFVPLSQLAAVGSLAASAEGASVPAPLKEYIGRRIPLKVIEADQRRDRLILSEKAAAQQLRRARKAKAAEQLNEGDVLAGTVANVTNYGLFVDVGVADGLVHRSEITWDKGIEPLSRYHAGDPVQVKVVGVDRERQRISLSIKQTEEDPWIRVGRELRIGSDGVATVTRVMPYGAFARLETGIEGLIHVSEMSDRRVGAPEEIVRAGDTVRVRVVAIDPLRRRISLSMRQAEAHEQQA